MGGDDDYIKAPSPSQTGVVAQPRISQVQFPALEEKQQIKKPLPL